MSKIINANKFAAAKLKELRVKNNFTQEELAEKLNITQQQIARYENNKRQFKQDFLFKLADFFKVSINDFFPLLDNEDFKNSAMISVEYSEYTLEQIAKQCGVNSKELQDIISGANKLPEPKVIIKLAELLDYPPIVWLVKLGYIKDNTESDIEQNDLFNSGIRFLLNEKEVNQIIDYVKIYIEENNLDEDIIFDSYDIYSLKDNSYQNKEYSSNEVRNMLVHSDINLNKNIVSNIFDIDKNLTFYSDEDYLNNIIKKDLDKLIKLSDSQKKTILDLISFYLNQNNKD